METIDCIQGTESWIDIRLGKATASKFGAVLAGGEGKTRTKYMKELLLEIDEQTPAPSYRDKNMEAGTEKEPLAREYYEELNGVVVEQVGFIKFNEWVGGSPDGLVGDDGIIEIKCPLATTHYDYYNGIQKLPKAYIDQMQGLLWITDRKWCDFISFRPESKNRPYWSTKIERDEGYIQKIAVAVNDFVIELEELVKKLINCPFE